MKRKLIISLLLLGVACAIIGYNSLKNKESEVTITTLSIKDISDKRIDVDSYYLTLVLDDFVVNEYSLQCNKIELQTEKKIYDEVTVDSGFAGAAIEIPRIQNNDEFVMMLKEKNTGKWKIKGVTTQDNRIIQ